MVASTQRSARRCSARATKRSCARDQLRFDIAVLGGERRWSSGFARGLPSLSVRNARHSAATRASRSSTPARGGKAARRLHVVACCPSASTRRRAAAASASDSTSASSRSRLCMRDAVAQAERAGDRARRTAAKRSPSRVEPDRGREPAAPLERFGQHAVEAVVGRERDGGVERLPERAAVRRGDAACHRWRARRSSLRCCSSSISEARRHAGLEREALQQPLAERVDGLHLEAARRLDGAANSRARVRQLLGGRRRAGDVAQDLAQVVVGAVTQAARRSKTRVDISAAAALV